MKVINKENRQDGSTLLLVLLISVVMMSTLASYLFLVSNERTLAARSQDWNAAIPAAEAGIEEAMTQLAYAGTTNNLATNSWTHGGDGMYHKTRGLTSSSFYGTAIQMAAQPIIWSTGYVASPFYGTNNSIKRLVRVVVFKTSGIGYGILAKGTVSLSGHALMDSFDSTDPNHSTNGLYTQSLDTSNIVVLTQSTASGAINLSGGAVIAGTAITGPGGTVTGATSATTTRNDANVQINDPGLPAWTSNSALYSITLLSNTTVAGTNYTYVATNGNYEISTINVAGGKSMAISGNVSIYCTWSGSSDAVNISGSGYIYLTPNSSLTIYSAGNVTVSGGGVVNGSQRAINCSIVGLPTCSTVTVSGSANYVGTMNTPEANITDSGSGSMVGAFIGNTFNDSGGAGIHYDASLGASGLGYVVQSWNEMKAQ